MKSLANKFNKRFELLINPEEPFKDQCYALRYEFFCKEKGIIPENRCDNGLEYDQFDEHATLIAIVDKQNKSVVATARHQAIAKQCPTFAKQLDERTLKQLKGHLDTQKAAGTEVSRIAIAPDFRLALNPLDYRPMDGLNPMASHEPIKSLQTIPTLLLVLIMASQKLTINEDLEHLYALLNPQDSYQLSRYGLFFNQVGHLSESRYALAPYRSNPQQTANTIHPELEGLLTLVHQVIDKGSNHPWWSLKNYVS